MMVDIDVRAYLPNPRDPRIDAGTVLSLIPGHAKTTWTYPTLPNLAAAQAASLGIEMPTVDVVSNRSAGTGLVEVSTRRSLQFISSQTVDVVDQYTGINLNESGRSYVDSRIADDWYLSAWLRPTRLAPTLTSPSVFPAAAIRHTNITAIDMSVGWTNAEVLAGSPGSADAARIGFLAEKSGGEWFIAVGRRALAAGVLHRILHAGPYAGSMVNKTPSFLLRGLMLSNLTAGGVTFAQKAALDRQQWLTHLGTTYAGDAWADPAVLCP